MHLPRSLSPGLLAAALLCALIASTLGAAGSQPGEPVALEVAAFFPEAEGDSWLFSPPQEESELRLTLHVTEATADGVRRIDSSDGAVNVEQANARIGWALLEEAALGGRRLTFEEPLELVPARTETGATHESEVRYRAVRDEAVLGTGTIRATVEVGALAVVEAPAGTFEDCLVLDVTLELISDDDAEEPLTSQRRLWRAPGVGPVRESSGPSLLEQLFPDEAESPSEPAEWVLVEAAVSGTLVTSAEDPRPEIDLGTFEPPPR